MSVVVAFESLGGGEAGEDLIQVIQSLCDAASPDGPRYDSKTIRTLTQLIAARAYGPPMLELAHLLALAEDICKRHGAAELFWGVDPARISGFRALIETRLATLNTDAGAQADRMRATYALEPSGVRFLGHAFLVNYARMPLLAALYEVIAVTVGFDALAAAGRQSADDPGGAANALSRSLYIYLRDRLPTATHQKTYRRMVDHMIRRRGGTFSLEDVDDAAVLAFWSEDQGADTATAGEGLRAYRSVVSAALKFRRALRGVLERRAMENAIPIGTDREAGEIDPGTFDVALPILEEDGDALAELSTPPLDAVKFLNKRERERIDLIAAYGREAAQLPLSILRDAVFGDQQARLTEALRRSSKARKSGGRGSGNGEIHSLIQEGPRLDYGERAAMLEKILAHIAKCRLACLYVMVVHERPAAILLLRDLFGEADLGKGMGPAPHDEAANDTPHEEPYDTLEDAGSAITPRQLRTLMRDLKSPDSTVAAEIRQGARAFSRIARHGFDEATISDPHRATRFEEAAPLLARLAVDLGGFVGAAAAILEHPGRRPDFEGDCKIFAARFHKLYGDAS